MDSYAGSMMNVVPSGTPSSVPSSPGGAVFPVQCTVLASALDATMKTEAEQPYYCCRHHGAISLIPGRVGTDSQYNPSSSKVIRTYFVIIEDFLLEFILMDGNGVQD